MLLLMSFIPVAAMNRPTGGTEFSHPEPAQGEEGGLLAVQCFFTWLGWGEFQVEGVDMKVCLRWTVRGPPNDTRQVTGGGGSKRSLGPFGLVVPVLFPWNS